VVNASAAVDQPPRSAQGKVGTALVGIVCGAVWALALATPGVVQAGAQVYQPLSASVRTSLNRSLSDHAAPFLAFATEGEARQWLTAMSKRLASRIIDRLEREEFLVTVHYEAKRAGLDPQLVLGLIQVESNFRKYAVSRAGARGFMQVMPFWVPLIGRRDDNLFHLRTNLRYGCVILRHYLDMENGDLYRALGRYNGSLGKAEYPTQVVRAWQRDWNYLTQAAASDVGSDRPLKLSAAGF
jgi:soluble lytic murein transglycosylase-like protein